MDNEWKSPRKIEEELKEYRRQRFETWMELSDKGEISRELAIQALREEEEYLIWTPQELVEDRD